MILSRAPFRISLGGGGTDLPSYYSQHGGMILGAAINKYLYIYVNRPAADDFIRVKYSQYEQVRSLDEIKHDLVRPALKLLKLDRGLEIVSMSDVPAGTGLGSSGTYLVCLLNALYEFKREKIPTQALAEFACHIEMDLAGHPVGKQDHYLAAFGGITYLEIGRDGQVMVSPLNMSITSADEFRNSVLLFYTGVLRSSTDILIDQKRGTNEGEKSIIESLHRTKELGYQIKESLEKGDIDKFGLLLDQHWQMKKKRSEKISTPIFDRWYNIAKENGALGGKIIGAGGGGFFMFFCPIKHKNAIRKSLKEAGLREMAYDFDFEGVKTLVNF